MEPLDKIVREELTGPVLAEWIPADPNRCQTTWLDGSFMTLGPRQEVRCNAKPTCVAIEKEFPHGSLSLCGEHKVKCAEKLGDAVLFAYIERDEPKGVTGKGKKSRAKK